jgi:hypothetical protein
VVTAESRFKVKAGLDLPVTIIKFLELVFTSAQGGTPFITTTTTCFFSELTEPPCHYSSGIVHMHGKSS